MPKLGAPLDFAQMEAKQFVAHLATAAPTSPAPVKGQLYFNTIGNELYYYDGTIWQSAKSGIGAGGPPTGAAGGNLAGTYPNPTIGLLQIDDTHIKAANKDGLPGTPSLRTLGNSAGQAMNGTISFNAFATSNPPLADWSNNGRKITSLGTPTAATDAATMGYVDGKTPADATTGVKGIVQLAGDLAGTAASPQIAAGVITDAEVAAANKDGAVGTASMRTLGGGAQQAMPGQRGLDQIANNFAAVGPVSMAAQRITNVGSPSNPGDAATMAYVDNVAQGLDVKASCRAATTVNITLSGTQTIDGVAVVGGDRVLVKDQSTTNQQGIYVVAAGAWGRATDADAWTELPGAFTFIEQGTVNAETGWVCTADQGGTLNTTPVPWYQFAGAGQITGGAGLLRTGNDLAVGAGAGITVNADSVQVANNGITNAMLADGAVALNTADVTGTLPIANGGTGATSAVNARSLLNAVGRHIQSTHGAGTTISIPQATHGLSAVPTLVVQVQDAATGVVELPDVQVSAGGNVTVTYGASVGANTKHVTILG